MENLVVLYLESGCAYCKWLTDILYVKEYLFWDIENKMEYSETCMISYNEMEYFVCASRQTNISKMSKTGILERIDKVDFDNKTIE